MKSLTMLLLLGTIACGSSEPQDMNAQSPTGEVAKENTTPAKPEDFIGEWEAVSDDETNIERAKLEMENGEIRGVVQSFERGYFSGQVTKKAEAFFTATPANGTLDLSVTNPASNEIVKGRAFKRGDYLILSVAEFQTAYARPGTSLVRNAEGSKDAEALARSVAGMIYGTRTSASGRGAFVGGRMRLALCSDGSAAFDRSDIATTGGADAVDLGDAVSRRGKWSIVLYAGEPAIRAQWEGTGTSYSLTRYFRVEPHKNGSGARVDGVDLGVAGSC